MRDILVLFFQQIFGSRPSGAYRWSPDAKETEITITTELPVHPDAYGARPALVLARQAAVYMPLGLDHFDNYDPQTDTTTYTTMLQGSFVIYSLSRLLLESERLAQFVASTILTYRRSLQEQGKFYDVGQAPGIGAPSTAGSIVAEDRGDSVIATPVSIGFYLPWSVRITPLNRGMLQGVDVEAQIVSAPNQATQPQPYVPGYPPNKVPPEDYPGIQYRMVPRRTRGRPLPVPTKNVAPLNPPKPIIVKFGV